MTDIVPRTPGSKRPVPAEPYTGPVPPREPREPPERLHVDAAQIRATVTALFRYASADTVVSLRTFLEGADGPPLSIRPVRLNGEALEPLIDAAIAEAQAAADFGKPAVFCPPVCSFSTDVSASEAHVAEAYVISVECDAAPAEARRRLEAVLGPATLWIASGGLWTDPATGEVQDKVHGHWRLTEPATGADLALLKQARWRATRFVGGDPSGVPVVHPMRWAGSWHRKAAPRLARIVASTETEIDLREALERLEAVQPAATEPQPGPGPGRGSSRGGAGEAGDPRPDRELIAHIMAGTELHPSTVRLAARYLGRGMHPGAVVGALRDLMEAIPAESRDARWRARWNDIPKIVRDAEAKWRRTGGGGSGGGGGGGSEGGDGGPGGDGDGGPGGPSRRQRQIKQNARIGEKPVEPELPTILSIPEMEKRLVYLSGVGGVADQVTGRVRRKEHAFGEYAASTFILKEETEDEPDEGESDD